jgi:hypothetical protein
MLSGGLMLYDIGCRGRIDLGDLPTSVARRLEELLGEWLEFDVPSGAIVVRHIQPTDSPMLPTIASELVGMLAEIPVEHQEAIPGGNLYVHTEEGGQIVRMRVEVGGALHIRWAHPDYERAGKRPYTGERETGIEPVMQRLNGRVTFGAANPTAAAEDLQKLADTYEGLYPEGDFVATADAGEGTVSVELADVNLDVDLLVAKLQAHAQPTTLGGGIEVSAFDEPVPEEEIRFLFENGQPFVQQPLLWPKGRDGSGG